MNIFIRNFVFFFCLFIPNLSYSQYNVLLYEVQTKYAYRGEKESRASNIELAVSKLTKNTGELIISPLTAVSFNAMVGPRNHLDGFKEAPVIINGHLIDEYGGGVCQVSGTLYAAAFLSGFEILESKQHSRTSAYIDPGLDSTVSWGTKDLVIKNPFTFPVKIKVTTYRDEKTRRGILTVQIFGKEQIYRVEHETIVHYKSRVRLRKVLLENRPKGYRKLIEAGTPKMGITRIRRIFEIKTNKLVLEEKKEIRYTASDRIIYIGIKE